MNRAVTRESYARRLQRVIEHIWTRLDAPLDLEALAQVACLSPYHFHRIYRAMIGETVAETASTMSPKSEISVIDGTMNLRIRPVAPAGHVRSRRCTRC